MLTAEELSRFPLLAQVPRADLERLAASAPDIHLEAGEYAVHEGEERALFLVLEGELEVTRQMDGVARVVGKRTPGQYHGEVPIAMGTPFLGGARASQPTRLVRIGVRQYYALAAACPQVAEEIGRMAAERMGGLRGMAREAPVPQAVVCGHRWDTACHELRHFLARNQVAFDWVTPEEAGTSPQWRGPALRDGDFPAVCLKDGGIMVKPPPRELARRLGLQIQAKLPEYDTVIVGAGPAGLAAAVYGASEGLKTLVVEREAPGGQAGTSSRIENYLGFPNGLSGDELAMRALLQARRLGAEILVTRSIERIDPVARWIYLDGGEVLRARSVILATGVSWRRMDVEGLARLIGKGIYYGAARSEADAAQGLDIHLVGAGNSAGQAALFFANHARQVTLLVRGDSLEKGMSHYLVEQLRRKSNIAVALNCEVLGVHGTDHLSAVDIADRVAGTVRREDSAGLFVFIGADAQTGWLPPEIARDPRGYVVTGADVVKSGAWSQPRDPYLLETSVPGIFACGDVRLSPVKRVAAAVGEGSMAIAFTHQYLATAK
ncbi:MAG: FAD-dependent oxidoreductase [Burkholderiales bacterium]|nr:FAD-dependent oxidoreductase [Burkholderiales bacterium]